MTILYIICYNIFGIKIKFLTINSFTMNKINVSEIQDRKLQIIFAFEKKEKEFYPKNEEEWDLYFSFLGTGPEISFLKLLFFKTLEKENGDIDKALAYLENITPDISEKLKTVSFEKLFESFSDLPADYQKMAVFQLQIKTMARLFVN